MTIKASTKAIPNIRSDFENLMKENGCSNESQAVAVKRMLALQLERDMQRVKLTKAAMARRMGTTRAQLDRVLDSENASTTLQTLVKAADAVGKRVKIVLISK